MRGPHRNHTKQRRSLFVVVVVSILALLVGAAEAHRRGNPTKQFSGDQSSPVLFITGLRPNSHDYVIARIHDIKPLAQLQPSQERVVSVNADLHDLRPLVLRPDRNEGVRAIAVPDFYLNNTATLRIAIWFPCRDVPPDVGVVVAPCFFEPLEPEFYFQTHLPSMEEGRRATFFIRHHKPQAMGMRDLAEDEEDEEDEEATTVEYVTGLDEYGNAIVQRPEDHKGPTTRASCWLPPPRSLELDPVPLDVARHSHWLQVTRLYHQSRGRHSAAAMAEEESMHPPLAIDEFGNPHPGLDPDVWYGYELKQHNPTEHKRATVDGQDMCRSWLLVSWRQGETAGWSVLPPHTRGGASPGSAGGGPGAVGSGGDFMRRAF